MCFILREILNKSKETLLTTYRFVFYNLKFNLNIVLGILVFLIRNESHEWNNRFVIKLIEDGSSENIQSVLNMNLPSTVYLKGIKKKKKKFDMSCLLINYVHIIIQQMSF